MPYLENVQKEIAVIKAKPPWMLYLGGFGLLCVIGYLIWMIWDIKHPKGKPGLFIHDAPVAEEVADMETTTTTTTITYIKDKPKAEQALKIPVSNNPNERLLTGVNIAANKYGATAAVYQNTSTAKTRVALDYKEAPWFALKRDLAIGGGYGIGAQGQTYAGRVRVDVMQIKEITVSPEIELNYAVNRKEPVESRFMIWAEWRP